MIGFIYAVECAGRVKIGYSEDPQRRLAKISSDAPFPCRLLGYWPGGVSDEAELHARYADVRVHGEWFAATAALHAEVVVRSVATAAAVEDVGPPVEPMSEDWPTIIRRARLRCGGGNSDLARYLGVSHSQVSRWEAGLSSPRRASREMLRGMIGTKPEQAA